MILTDVMGEVATALSTITGLRVHAFPADTAAVPAALVGYPETVTFDVAMQRGQDKYTLPVFLLVGRLSDRVAQKALGPYLNGSGTKSVKAAVQNGTYVAASAVRVTSATVDVLSMNSVDYLAAVFSLDIYGPGG